MAYSCLFVLKQASSKNKNLSFQVHTLMLIKCLLINILNRFINWKINRTIYCVTVLYCSILN